MRLPQQAPEIPGHTYVRLISNKGGFGDVYLFEEVALHRSVAIKVIRDTALDPATQSRFENEARTMAGLEHPNVVRIYATGRARDGRPYISMMHCPKPTLAQRAAAGQLPLSEVLDIGISVQRMPSRVRTVPGCYTATSNRRTSSRCPGVPRG